MKLISRTQYEAPKATNAERRTAVEAAGFTLHERGPWYRHAQYNDFVFSLAAAHAMAANGMPAQDGTYVLRKDTR
jgi:hypothetical protein